MSQAIENPSYQVGSDAVCFTAGTEIAAFGAGTVHAYLAMDRAAPQLVVGISTGALIAAVFRRCYQELGKSPGKTDSARWAFFRRYLEHVTHRPFEVIWDGLPDPTDFYADHLIHDRATPQSLRRCEHTALVQRHRLVQLGHWLARSPLQVRDLANLSVTYVRWCEQYQSSTLLRGLHLVWAGARAGTKLLSHLAFSPCFYHDPVAPPDLPPASPSEAASPERGLGPLFGYGVWLAACALLLLAAGTALAPLGILAYFAGRAAHLWSATSGAGWPLLGGGGACLLIALLVVVLLRIFWSALVSHLFEELRIKKSLLSDYYLHRLLFSLFGDDQVPDKTEAGPHPVIVCAPLQTLAGKHGEPLIARQLYAEPGTPIVQALLTATAVPGIFAPTDLRSGDEHWAPLDNNDPDGLQLVDGSLVRHNPLPAFFRYLRDNADLAKQLDQSGAPSVHMVYSVPIEPRNNRSTIADADANAVDVGLAALRLNRRCDTQLEVLQTNFLSGLYRIAPDGQHFPLTVDEIAPDPDTSPLSSLGWSTEATRKEVASGCKRTLRVLYAKELAERGTLSCRTLASARSRLKPGEKPGLPEICAQCDGQIAVPAQAAPVTGQHVNMASFAQLKRASSREPRIVLVASGGVFRGAFHVGMAGALWLAKAKPDLVVGASVGTLMGGVVAAMFQEERHGVPAQLTELVKVFMKVDERVALTKTLKSAARELGLRGRSISLSPKEVRRAFMRGSRGDAGFAATGAPPVLIDALSDLFMIPHQDTAAVARRFIAGDITGALMEFGRLAKAHTLPRLGIENAFMGSSLIEGAARELLGGGSIDLRAHQPYMNRHAPRPAHDVAFFATATDLGTESLFWLGDDSYLKGSDYDFVESALASSAFPFVFAPRRASDLYPGNGDRDRRYSDGGLFDNLPFVPAIQLLADAQGLGSAGRELREVIQDRVDCPDLFLVGALDLNPEEDLKQQQGAASGKRKRCEHLIDINKRGGALRKNVKIRSFERTSRDVDAALRRTLAGSTIADASPEQRELLNSVVNAAVLPIFPSDDKHLNGTFAFCASLGFKPEVVALSIANGCYQTLQGLAPTENPTACDEFRQRSLSQLRKRGRIITVQRLPLAAHAVGARPAGECPYFGAGDGTNLPCPFHNGDPTGQVVHQQCISDAVHRAAALVPAAGA